MLVHYFEWSNIHSYMALVAQLVRVADCGSEGREFETHLTLRVCLK